MRIMITAKISKIVDGGWKPGVCVGTDEPEGGEGAVVVVYEAAKQ